MQEVYYFPYAKRGTQGRDTAGILPHLQRTVVHDGWAAYARYSCRHALCNAHHLRELTALHETDGQEWAKAMRSLLSQMHSAVEEAKTQGEARLPLLREARRLLPVGWNANPPLAWSREREMSYAFCMTSPFLKGNNLAERDVRMRKVKQKVSGCFRAFCGVEGFCLTCSYVSTMCKQGQSLLSALQHVCEDNPLQPNFMPE